MYIVYLLQSVNNPNLYYVGYTNDVDRRLQEHNAGLSCHTKKGLPWKIQTYVTFDDEAKAKEFEKYLKTGSGRVFSLRHF